MKHPAHHRTQTKRTHFRKRDDRGRFAATTRVLRVDLFDPMRPAPQKPTWGPWLWFMGW